MFSLLAKVALLFVILFLCNCWLHPIHVIYYLYSCHLCVILINFRLWYKRHTKIPGGECHRLEIWDMELMRLFMHSCRKTASGDPGRHAGEPVRPYCACVVFFPPEEGSRQLWHHLLMSQMSCLCTGYGVYGESAHKPRGYCLGFWSWTFW